jgi:hypothetical protein
VPLGIAVRRANYFNADPGAVAGGGLSFNASALAASLVLMGDSNGSMYGRMARDIARERDLRLRIISVADGDPLPGGPLWRDSLAVVERERPDAVLLVCEWLQKLDERGDRLPEAVRELRRYARLVVLITEPPQLRRQRRATR